MIEATSAFPTEIGTAFELHRRVATAVAEAARGRALPLVLSGNCNSPIGTFAGLQSAYPGEPVGVVWFDRHGDCNTPETFTGDFLDAMGLSTLTGRRWQALTRTLPDFAPVPDDRVILIGGLGMDDGARGILDASNMTNVASQDVLAHGIDAALGPALGRLRASGVGRVYVHLDVDVLDAQRVAPANEFAPRHRGLGSEDVAAAVNVIALHFTIGAAAVASYDPAFDRGDRVLRTALNFLTCVASGR
jgi:arginase